MAFIKSAFGDIKSYHCVIIKYIKFYKIIPILKTAFDHNGFPLIWANKEVH
jgi:hypothetical protein